MPEHAVLDDQRAALVAVLGAYIEELPIARELSRSEVLGYSERGFEFGWSVPVAFGDCVREFHVLIGAEFPFYAPRIALIDPPAFLSWPHVEKDGVLCLLPNNSTISAVDPVTVFRDIFARAVNLVDSCRHSENATDFEREFNTYWAYRVSEGSKRCISILTLDVRDRIVALWRGKDLDVVGEDGISVQRWLARRYGKTNADASEYHFARAAIFWLPRALHPSQYPVAANDLRVILGTAGGKIVAEILTESTQDIMIVLAAKTANGPVLAGLRVTHGSRKNVMGRAVPQLARGFRPRRVPQAVLFDRFLIGGAALTRTKVERADHEWIHGRDRDSRQRTLKASSAIIIGCGSLGSAVAVTLAKSGLGKLTLIDHEVLEWANISRHALGGNSVGMNKAAALADQLNRNYPHLEVIHKTLSLKQLLLPGPSFLNESNLMISLTADWGMEQALSMWHRRFAPAQALIYGWMEAHACAGHAVFVGDTSRIEDGRDHVGLSLFAVTDWPDDQSFFEPACGGSFQPYGATELGNSVSLVSTLALDCLISRPKLPVHRFWVGAKSQIVSLGGGWTRAWSNHPQFRDCGGYFVEQPWPPENIVSNSGEVA
jgi:sulfur-carrier protein adenylyltransferase/sulfurtransferase